MATFKVTMIFNQGVNGWSESWYWSTDDVGFFSVAAVVVGTPPIGQIPALARWYEVCKRRVNLLSSQGVLQAIRLSDVASPRSSFLDESVSSLLPPKLLARDVKRRALIGTAQAGEAMAYRRVVTLRGIPDDTAFMTEFGASGYANMEESFKLYAQALLAAGARVKCLTKDIPAGVNPDRVITRITTDGAPQRFVFVTAVPHGLTPGANVRIRGVRTIDAAIPPPLNGVFQVTPYAGGTFDAATAFTILTPFSTDYTGFRYIGGGKVRNNFFSYQAVTAINADRWGSHRTGAAFFAGRGRSRAKLLRR